MTSTGTRDDADVRTPLRTLREMCTRARDRASSPALVGELTAIADALDRPLQLAVAGAVSAGKSTLINALLGRAVAPSDAGECTRVVTWYEYGDDDGSIVVETPDGRRAARLHDGRMPDDLGVGVDDVVRLRVRLRDERLRTVTVIDTPGIDNVVAASEEATRRLLFGDRAAEQAQALLYVMRHVQTSDAAALTEFRALSNRCGLTAVNTTAVLSNVDRYGDEPWPIAWGMVDKAAVGLRGMVLDVVPVAALLAETGRARLLDDDDVAGLAALGARSPQTLGDALEDLDEYAGEDTFLPVPASAVRRRRLVGLLHRYGIGEAARFLSEHPGAGRDALHEHLVACSGFGSPGTGASGGRTSIDDVMARFARHADALKAHAALVRVRDLGRLRVPADTAVVDELLRVVDEGRELGGALRELRILVACAAMSTGELRLDDAMSDELLALARGRDTAERLGSPTGSLAAAAREASARWRGYAMSSGPTIAGRRAADVAGYFEDTWFELTAADVSVEVPDDDRRRIRALADAAFLDDATRASARRLADAHTRSEALGCVPRDEGDAARLAAGLASDLRAAMNHPFADSAQQHAARLACGVFELLAATTPPGGPA